MYLIAFFSREYKNQSLANHTRERRDEKRKKTIQNFKLKL